MYKLKNENVLKNNKKNLQALLIGVMFLVLGIILLVTSVSKDEESLDNMTDLNDIIMNEENKNDKNAYLNITNVPYKFAVYDGKSDSYYIVTDGEYLYVIYMSDNKFATMDDENDFKNSKKITGVTHSTTKDIKKLAIDAYNDSMEDEEDKITLADFDNYFGEVYLDTTTDFTDESNTYALLAILSCGIAITIFLVVFIKKIRFKKAIKKYDDETLELLDEEMSSEEAFYYAKLKLYLTKDYIININGTFKAIKYSDILWMYPFEQRVNGVKTSQAIKVFTSDGKTNIVAIINITTKSKKEMYNEIWNTILDKNDKITTGYSSENIKHFNQVRKEIKKNKKESL